MQAIGADANDWDRHFKLVADIDLSAYTGTEFNIIGHYERHGHPSNKPFTGVFDGNGHSISNFTYNSAAINYIGLFAYVDGPNAEIKDLTLIEPTVNANDRVGSLVGYLLVKGTISNCGVEGGSVWGDFLVGGLVGFNYDGCISNCYSTANVNGNDLTGGLAGANFYPGDPKRGSMSNCYAAGNVVGNVNTGGLVGGAGFCAIVNSYSVSAVNGNEHTGGLVGNIWGDSPMFLSNCYAAGSVSGATNVGGLVGYEGGGVLTSYTKCFWDSDVNPDVNGIGNTSDSNVIGESTANMQTRSTFTDAGWDFVGEVINGPNDIWRMCVDDVNYPLLSWQFNEGDFICPDGVNFFDFSFFSEQWTRKYCAGSNDCDGRDLDQLGTVENNDLRIFADNWLAGF
jgi:hypothetical protein